MQEVSEQLANSQRRRLARPFFLLAMPTPDRLDLVYNEKMSF